VRQWLSERRLVLATGLAAGLPVIVATIDVATSGWTPLADDALIAVRAYDVFSGHSPLVGQYSQASAVVGQPLYSPGPLLYWLLALPVRLPWDPAPEVTVGLVNLACVMGVVGLACRRGGRPLMFATALAVPIMLASLPTEAYSDVWNPYAPLLPLLLLLFLAWSVGCGEYRLLPLAVLCASFAPQSHLSFVAPAAGAFAIGVGGLVLSQRAALLRPPAQGWIAAALLVGVVCWSAPAIDQATNSPGNARLLYQAARAEQPKLGLASGWRGVVHTVGVVPWWLRDPQFGLERIVDLSEDPGALATGSTVLMLAALAALFALAWRRRRQDLAVAATLALTTCAAVLIVIASTPESSFATLAYSVRWVSPVGLWVWIALGWSAAALAGARLRRPAPAGPRGRAAALASAGPVAAVLAVGAVVGASGGLRREPYDEMRTIAERLEADLPRDLPPRVVVSASPEATFTALGIQSGIVYALRRDGRRVVAPGVVDSLGPEYGPAGTGSTQLLRIDAGTKPPSDGRVLVRLPVQKFPEARAAAPPGPTPSWPVAVTLIPPDGER
jgi:hypothetical protein